MAKAIKARTSQKRNARSLSKLNEHSIWLKIRSRCYRHGDKSFPRYGGRGIVMSEEWRTCFFTLRLTPDVADFCRQHPDGFVVLEEKLRASKEFREWLKAR